MMDWSDVRGFFRGLWRGFASLGEGMSMLFDPYKPPKQIKGRKLRAEARRSAAQADLSSFHADLARIRAKKKRMDEASRRFAEEAAASGWTIGVQYGTFGKPQPMTPERRERLRQHGLNDFEIEMIATLNLPPILQALFITVLRDARKKTKAKEYPWWRDLGLQARPTSRDEARKAYSKAMLKAHPDHGGDAVTMAKVRAAWERAQQEFPESVTET